MANAVIEEDLLKLARAGDQNALNQLLEMFRPRLKRMIELRVHPSVNGRFDDSDVIQEAFIEVSHRFNEFVQDPSVPFLVWLRYLTLQKLGSFHRRHLGADKRDARRDLPLVGFGGLAASSEQIAMQLIGETTSPSSALIQQEMVAQLSSALNSMGEVDREILVLRHFDQLTNAEAAAVLGLNPSAASSRYVRALAHLKEALSKIPGFIDELR